ncbi:MAG: mechanosensitive ion channel family protein [Alteromonadaceae bacterium]|nr:mechanosensitive ion channel family protein [Alteromonadaceae bacterium]
MKELISAWLTEQGISAAYLSITTTTISGLIIFILCALSYYFAKHQVLTVVHRLVIASRNSWDDLLIEHKVFTRIALLFPLIVLLFLIPHLLPTQSLFSYFLTVVAKVGITFQVARAISALLNTANSLYDKSSSKRYLPINATVQLIKLVVYIVATILAISFVLDKSPVYLLSGLGALTAVLLLIFQDTIKGLVASIQISANRMVAPGDWIEMPKYGADGDVVEIGLNTVKVKNFDHTVTTIPTYALVSESFKNWRGMAVSGGRRIKRSIIIDVNSVHFCDQQELNELNNVALLKGYLVEKQQQLQLSNQQNGIDENDRVNARNLTNIGTFRAYIEVYLQQHTKVHKQMTCMVRQLPASPTGLPLELYFFTNDTVWANYENIQADIFDHLFAMAKHFNLRIFQQPSGYDWQATR